MQSQVSQYLSFTQIQSLNSHLKTKHSNNQWLQKFVAAEVNECPRALAHTFPYKLSNRPSIKGRLLQQEIEPKLANAPDAGLSARSPSTLPNYIVTIPCNASNDFQLESLLVKIRDQSFGKTSEESIAGQDRLAIVAGMNRMRSLDSDKNTAFKKRVREIKPLASTQFKASGRLWAPVWDKTENYQERNSFWDERKSFKVLKWLRPDLASSVLSILESGRSIRNQVPFVELREWVKNLSQTLDFANMFFKVPEKSIVYIATMDADILALRAPGGEGLFTIYDGLVNNFMQKHCVMPQLMSTGYQVEEDSKDVLRLAVRIDMRIRQAMSSIDSLKLAPYYPEPNTLFLIERPEDLRRWKFTGREKSLESLRLIQNAVAEKILDPSRAIFNAVEALITQTPDRMLFTTHEKIGILTEKNVGSLQTLKALRGISQSHLFPKNWAERLYPWLHIKTSQKTDVTTPLMKLFSLFDVQASAVSFPRGPGKSNYSPKNFSLALEVLSQYSPILEKYCLKKINRKEAKNDWYKRVSAKNLLSEASNKSLLDFFEAKLDISKEVLGELTKQGLTAYYKEQCILCASKTGATVIEEMLAFKAKIRTETKPKVEAKKENLKSVAKKLEFDPLPT